MFDQFTHLVAQASGWAYLVILAFALIDAILPIVPSETAVITAGVVAAAGELNVVLVIAAAAVGAFAGDNIAYGLGRHYGPRSRRLRGDKARRRIGWAQKQLDQRGGELIVIARFIPGGRTAVTVAAGITQFPWRRFAVFDAIAAVIWAGYATLLGYFGGKAFEHEAWKGLLLALGAAFTVTALTELVRWGLRRRGVKERGAAS